MDGLYRLQRLVSPGRLAIRACHGLRISFSTLFDYVRISCWLDRSVGGFAGPLAFGSVVQASRPPIAKALVVGLGIDADAGNERIGSAWVTSSLVGGSCCDSDSCHGSGISIDSTQRPFAQRIGCANPPATSGIDSNTGATRWRFVTDCTAGRRAAALSRCSPCPGTAVCGTHP